MNTILTDEKREFYKPVIDEMWQLCPIMMERKLERANCQQAYTFDTTRKFVSGKEAKILSVGAYEDTASESLLKLGYNVICIDPALNTDLDGYFKSSEKEIFDVILSTSVIEHVPDDETFLEQICKLLKPGGHGVLTCDFKDGWKGGDPKPDEDHRLYTKHDLLGRLHKVLIDNNCSLVGEPNYDYPPDFQYGVYTYSFATYTFMKNK